MSDQTYSFEYPKRLKAVAIGCGGHAYRNVFPTFKYAPIDLAAVCDVNIERAEAVGTQFGAKNFYGDYVQMLEIEKPDVMVAVLNYDDQGHPKYPAIVLDALQRGVNVWIEKPPAYTVAEIEAMMAASKVTGKLVGVGFKKMFFPANVKALSLTKREDFGDICTISARYPQSLPAFEERHAPRSMTGFLDHMVHPYSTLRLLGGPIESIYFQREERTGGSHTIVRFCSGAVGNLHMPGKTASYAPLERTEIVGSKGMIVIDNNIRVTYYKSGNGPGSYGKAADFFGADDEAPLHWEPEFSLGQLYNKGIFLLGYVPEITYFCDCVLERRPPEKGNLGDALELLRVFEAYNKEDGRVHTIQQAS